MGSITVFICMCVYTHTPTHCRYKHLNVGLDSKCGNPRGLSLSFLKTLCWLQSSVFVSVSESCPRVSPPTHCGLLAEKLVEPVWACQQQVSWRPNRAVLMALLTLCRTPSLAPPSVSLFWIAASNFLQICHMFYGEMWSCEVSAWLWMLMRLVCVLYIRSIIRLRCHLSLLHLLQ